VKLQRCRCVRVRIGWRSDAKESRIVFVPRHTSLGRETAYARIGLSLKSVDSSRETPPAAIEERRSAARSPTPVYLVATLRASANQCFAISSSSPKITTGISAIAT
jgi:hypothetical protein